MEALQLLLKGSPLSCEQFTTGDMLRIVRLAARFTERASSGGGGGAGSSNGVVVVNGGARASLWWRLACSLYGCVEMLLKYGPSVAWTPVIAAVDSTLLDDLTRCLRCGIVERRRVNKYFQVPSTRKHSNCTNI